MFIGCNFETDSCEWTDISVGQFVWERDQNGTTTANTGPSVDHTTGTELGKKIEQNYSEVKRFVFCLYGIIHIYTHLKCFTEAVFILKDK